MFHTIDKSWTVTARERLDVFLRRELLLLIQEGKEASNSKIRRLIIAGSVNVNGRVCKTPAFELHKGSTVSVHLDEEKFFFEKKPDDIDFVLTSENVLFEDENIIVVNKPAFFPTEETIVKGRGNMHQAVIDYLWKKNPSLRNPPYAGIMHRLDRETSGTLLFTKTRAANKAVHDMFENHTAVKTYRAVCFTDGGKSSSFKSKSSSGFYGKTLEPGMTFCVENYIGRISAKSQTCMMGELAENRGGLYARTDFEVVKKVSDKKYGNLYYIDCTLLTGRTHQIRVHLSGAGFPIVGDELYGAKCGFEQNGSRIMLHSKSLKFQHPVTGETVLVEAPLPHLFE